MKKQVYTGKHYGMDIPDWERQQALEYGESGPGSMGVQQHEVLANIQLFLTSSFFLHINPLRGLRKKFPRYSWNFWDFVELDGDPSIDYAIKEAVSQADFIWRVHSGGECWWVTARGQSTNPLRRFGGGRLESLKGNNDSELFDLLVSCGVTNCDFAENIESGLVVRP